MTPTSEDMIPVEEHTAEPAAESVDAAPHAEASLAEDPAETEEAESPKPPRFQKLKRFVSALFVPENAMRLAFLLGPFAAYLMVEYLNGNDPFTSHLPGQVFFNLVWYGIIFWVMRMIIGRKGLSAAVSAAVCFGFGLANHYVLSFRGRIIFPCDLFSLQTAINVASNFDYTWNETVWKAFYILLGYCALLLLASLVFHKKGRQKLPRPVVIGSLAALAVWVYAFFFTPMLPSLGIWAQQWKTQSNGFLLNFMAALRYSFVSEPEDYSHTEVEEIVEFVEGLDEPEPLAPQTPENLIVIMNESFADMQASFPQLELSEDPLTFFHSLKENTIRGTILSPVSGGGTANVEYEFLTGGSLAFLPAGTVAYQLFTYDGLPSLSSQLKDAGYYNVAFHPYLSSGWNRTSVYKWLKFDRQLYDEDVKDPYIIREYISDFSDYEQLYQLTDEIDQPTFIFNVTMQNHSGYSQGWNNLGKTVRVTGGAKNTYPAIQYFSLMKESDRALQELIEHYSASDERTMVVFFGDHQPPLGTDFYKDLYVKELDDRTTEEVMQEYEAPFFIWANYDIPEADGLRISSNYLGALAAQAAGYELTEFQTMLLDLMADLPVCTTIGFQTADGTVYETADQLPADLQERYEDYRLMAYNLLFDEEHHPDNFFE